MMEISDEDKYALMVFQEAERQPDIPRKKIASLFERGLLDDICGFMVSDEGKAALESKEPK